MKKPFNQSWRLTLSYLGIIMVLSLLFSWIIYMIVASQLDRPLPPPPGGQSAQQLLIGNEGTQTIITQRNNETLASLTISLGVINILMFLGGSWFSYYMARRTLRPIEESMQAQAQFVSDASHELRTPLTALLAINEVTLRKKHIDEDKMQDTLQKNIVEIHKLSALTEALLGLANINQGLPGTQDVWLDKIVTEVIDVIFPSAELKKIKMRNEVAHVEAVVHSASIQQILTILLDNAIKYSPVGSTVTVSSRVMHHSTSISIADEGMGIRDSDRKKIFERFYRSDTARTRTDSSGHGLGLAIAKATAERNGYSISLESNQGNGSIFTVAIPS